MVKAFPAHADVDDMARVLIHMRAKYPKAPMLAIGFSMGSNVLVKYLGQYGQSPLNPLIGAVCAASGYDIGEFTVWSTIEYLRCCLVMQAALDCALCCDGIPVAALTSTLVHTVNAPVCICSFKCFLLKRCGS